MAKVTSGSIRLSVLNFFAGFVIGAVPLVLEAFILFKNFAEMQIIDLIILSCGMLLFYLGFVFELFGAGMICLGKFEMLESSLYASVAFEIAACALWILNDYRTSSYIVPIIPVLIIGYSLIALSYAYKRKNDNDWKMPGFWMLAFGLVALVFWLWFVVQRGWNGNMGYGDFQYMDCGILFFFIVNYFCSALAVYLKRKFTVKRVSLPVFLTSLISSLIAISYSFVSVSLKSGFSGIYLLFCSYLIYYSLGTALILPSIATHSAI